MDRPLRFFSASRCCDHIDARTRSRQNIRFFDVVTHQSLSVFRHHHHWRRRRRWTLGPVYVSFTSPPFPMMMPSSLSPKPVVFWNTLILTRHHHGKKKHKNVSKSGCGKTQTNKKKKKNEVDSRKRHAKVREREERKVVFFFFFFVCVCVCVCSSFFFSFFFPAIFFLFSIFFVCAKNTHFTDWKR